MFARSGYVTAVMNYESALEQASARLWAYFEGRNEEGREMEDTVPVAARMQLDAHPHGGRVVNTTFGLYLPEEYQKVSLADG